MVDASVVIPTFNRIERLKKTLANLENQDAGPDRFEVVAVSDGSSDGTDAYIQSLAAPFQFIPVTQPNQGAAVARNRGIQAASGRIIIFIDDDIVASPQLVSEHLAWHESCGDNAVVIGPMLAPPDFQLSPWVRWEQTMLSKQYQAMLTHRYAPTPRQFYTGNASLARRHLVECGGFDPSFRRAEDVELAYRLDTRGLRFFFNPEAIAYHYAERSFASWAEIAYAYGRNDVLFSREKNHAWLLPDKLSEFFERHILIQALVRTFLGRTRASQAVLLLLKSTVLSGERLRLAGLSRFACSAIFNFRYYQGISDEMGSREAFFTGLAKAREEVGSYA